MRFGFTLVVLHCVVVFWAGAESYRGTQWQPVRIEFEGLRAHASDNEPNPFLDYRLQVQFTGPSGAVFDVPGYFAGDGAGGGDGAVWRVYFAPPEAGEWQYAAELRRGAQIAVELEREAGEPVELGGARGTLTVAPRDANAPGFYALGRLGYAGGHYLKFADGPYWLKGGCDSPEDFLAYAGFVHTRRVGHRYANHVKDWREGDPDWDDGAGKGIVGALNYLASEKVNSIYFLPMNIGGDGKNVWPFLGEIDPKGSNKNDNVHYDIAKLEQWGIVFDHAQRLGMQLHVVLNEAEEPNKRELDHGELGVERKLYYRELVARFAHFPAIQWNLCEEYNLNIELAPELLKACAQYLRDIDPYDNPVTVHHADSVEKAWTPFLADPRFPVTSFQTRDMDVVEKWRRLSREGGFPQVIGMDEFFPDLAKPGNADRHRREYLWPIYMSGGQLEYILEDLLKTEDFRKYERHWRDMAHARAFIESLPFWEMEPRDALVTGAAEYQGKHNTIAAQVFAKAGEVYAVYLPVGRPSGAIDLSEAEGSFEQRWYNPRTGTYAGESRRAEGGTRVDLGAPPEDPEEDWAIAFTRL